MDKTDQIINYLSLSALEDVGLAGPTQDQLDCLEATLADLLERASLAILLLARAGELSPSVTKVKSISRGLAELMDESAKRFGADEK